MEFRPREVPTPSPAPNIEPPFVFVDENGKEIRVPMEVYRTLPQEKKEELLKKQMKHTVKDNISKGQHPTKPGYAITVVVENCQPEDIAKVTQVGKTCPAKMKLHEDYRLPINTYIVRYFILNGEEQKNIENHWIKNVPSVKFSIELENGLTEIHRRSIIDGPDGERMETSPLSPSPGFKGPGGSMVFNPEADMKKIAKPCVGCGKNRYDAPVGAK